MVRASTKFQSSDAAAAAGPPRVGWTFLSNHAHVLLCLAQDGLQRVRDVAALVGITERAVQKILSDLEESGAITRHREGRRNRYEVHAKIPLRHPIEAHRRIGDLVAMVLERQRRPGAR